MSYSDVRDGVIRAQESAGNIRYLNYLAAKQIFDELEAPTDADDLAKHQAIATKLDALIAETAPADTDHLGQLHTTLGLDRS